MHVAELDIKCSSLSYVLYLYFYDSFDSILLTCKVFTSSINYQLSHHSSIIKSPLHHTT
jgi:hypothetical protein